MRMMEVLNYCVLGSDLIEILWAPSCLLSNLITTSDNVSGVLEEMIHFLFMTCGEWYQM